MAAAQTRRTDRMAPWPRLARASIRAALGLLFRIHLEGRPPQRGPYVLIANHQGWADAFLILALFPAEPRVYFVADRTATMTAWWKRTLLRSVGVVVPVARDGTSERAAVARALRLLDDGAVVAIFPEGRVARAELGVCAQCLERGRAIGYDVTHGTHDHELAPFQRGVAYLAMKARVPVVPVWLQGTAELYLGRELVARVGDAIEVPAGPVTKEATQQVAAGLHDEFARVARPWSEPKGGPRRWRWLTHLF